MKVLIVFSSHGGSDEKFWHSLTDFNTPRNVNGGGMLCVFNGKEYHRDGRWKVSALKDKIKEVIDTENGGNEYAVLFHTQLDTELQKLITECSGINVSVFKKFSGAVDLYDDYIKKLDANSADSFNRLWRKIQEDETNEEYLRTLFVLCNSGASEIDTTMLHDFFVNHTEFNDTDICKELKAKRVDKESDIYKNIEALFKSIKGSCVRDEIVISARESLRKILD